MRRVVVALAVLGCSRPAPRHDDEPVRPVAALEGSAAGSGGAGSNAAVPPSAVAIVDAASVASVDAASVVDAATVAIVDAPMAWSAERAQLTLDYRRQHSDPAASDLDIAPRVIVLHYTDGSSAKATRGYFDNLRVEASRKELVRAGAVNVSAHFVVDRDGTIYQLQPPTRYARHCIGLNHIAIGIENAGDEQRWPLTDAQVAADAALVRMLAHTYPITHLLGHYEVMKFRDNPYYIERDANYHNDKPDPGARFMARVRAEVADLKLQGL